MRNKSEQLVKNEPKKFTKEELFKIALDYIDSMTNRGDSSNKADTGELVKQALAGYKGSFIEESIKKAHEMVENGEAEKIARKEYKGGLEEPKNYNESEDEED